MEKKCKKCGKKYNGTMYDSCPHICRDDSTSNIDNQSYSFIPSFISSDASIDNSSSTPDFSGGGGDFGGGGSSGDW